MRVEDDDSQARIPDTTRMPRAEIEPLRGTERIGAVMIVGGGVAGIQAALDLANGGFKVYLVDKAPAIGGRMARLDKTFPTNDCSMCILSPKLVECARNPNISIMTNTDLGAIDGEAGNFNVTLRRRPRYVEEDKCVGCGTCSTYCPVNTADAHNEALSVSKIIGVPYPQAVPAVAAIDSDRCLFLRRRQCKICVPVCKNKAIDFSQREQELTVEVGALVLAPGYEPFDPRLQSQYGYGRFKNVITSTEFERILSASGPFGGHVKRPSDKNVPNRVAWIQCVGSRDITADHGYCSAVCCMYAMKQVIIAKEHDSDLHATVFHNDVRSYGKGFERYYRRLRELPGVRYIQSKVSLVGEVPGSDNLVLRYCVDGTETREEEFDLVVLSVGLTSPSSNRELAELLSLRINGDGFCHSQSIAPVETSTPGIYVCGAFHAPMDIPDSVTTASAAASLSAQLLHAQRDSLTQDKEYPDERDVSAETPRVGVFVCRCGTNIARVVDVSAMVKYAATLGDVAHTEEGLFFCSIDSAKHLVEVVKDKDLNRVVMAACTPRTHEPLFRGTLREAGLNPYLFEMANIREQCSWVHSRDRAAANRKAQDLVRMAVAKARLLKPLTRFSVGLEHAALVVGGGVAGLVCGLSMAEMGFDVHLVEKGRELGGAARLIHRDLEGDDVQAYLHDLIQRVLQHPMIHVRTQADIIEVKGHVGNFTTKVLSRVEHAIAEIAHGVAVIAVGAAGTKPKEHLHENDRRVFTLLELEQEIVRGNTAVTGAQTAVFIHCVGSRDQQRPYCSRLCCGQSLRNALRLKQLDPDKDIYLLYRDMMTYGLKEDYYREAASLGVKFVRYDLASKPTLHALEVDGRNVLRVLVHDPVLGKNLSIDADVVGLATALEPVHDNRMLSQMFKVPLSEDGFFLEAHAKLGPVDFATEGVFLCGLAHYPKPLNETIAQAQAAAFRAALVLSKKELEAGGEVAAVDGKKCNGCGICASVCPFAAITVDSRERVAVVTEVLCKNCGACAAGCPSGACSMGNLGDQHILAELDVLC